MFRSVQSHAPFKVSPGLVAWQPSLFTCNFFVAGAGQEKAREHGQARVCAAPRNFQNPPLPYKTAPARRTYEGPWSIQCATWGLGLVGSPSGLFERRLLVRQTGDGCGWRCAVPLS
jgi:hypothetical protein